MTPAEQMARDRLFTVGRLLKKATELNYGSSPYGATPAKVHFGGGRLAEWALRR
jgi:hypothetical protein